MFEIENTWIYGKNKQYQTIYDTANDGRIPIVSGITINNGVNYYTEDILNDDELFSDCLTISTRGEYSGTVTYHEGNFGLANNILTMPMPNWTKNQKLFIGAIINSLSYGGYSGYPRKETLKNDIISLPIKSHTDSELLTQFQPNTETDFPLGKSNPCDNIDEIDFDFMESFIRELEEERIRELEEERIRELSAYLTVSGLSDATLTEREKLALQNFDTLEWKEFRYDEIFNHIEQGRRLKKDDQKAGNIPFVMSGVTNTGVVNYISNPVASFPANSLTVDIFGNTFYRSFAYGLGDDTGAYWSDEKEYSKEEMLFFTAAIGKSLAGKYSYGHKLRSSQSLGFKMLLPVRDGAPDYAAMQDFISAVQKLVIKDVVKYAEDKINATKKVVKNKDEYKTTEDKSFLLVAESADYKGIPR